jgi:hypothetical protein
MWQQDEEEDDSDDDEPPGNGVLHSYSSVHFGAIVCCGC